MPEKRRKRLQNTKDSIRAGQIDSSSILDNPNGPSTQGIPVSAGLVVGPARVIRDFSTEAQQIKKGEILITHAADTGELSEANLMNNCLSSL